MHAKNIFIFGLGLCIGVCIVLSIFLVSNKNAPSSFLRPLSSSQFSIAHAPSNALPATITLLTGDVSWKSRIATDASPITQAITLQQGEEVSTLTNGKAKLEIPEAGEIALAPETHMLLIQTLPENIVLVQTTGTADYIKQGTNTFSVRIFDVVANINDGMSSISIRNNTATITVTTGSITIGFNDANNVSHIQQVNAGYLVHVNSLTQQVKIALQ